MTEITCPSGLRGRIRSLTVEEERVFARKAQASGRFTGMLLHECWTETLDPGPYDIDDEINWRYVLQGDRFYALVQVRIETYGPNFEFKASCARCRERFTWQVDLASDLLVRELSASSRDAFIGGNRFVAELGADRPHVLFRLLVGQDEERLQADLRKRPHQTLATALRHRIVEVAGVTPSHLHKWVRALPMRDATDLLERIIEAECGVDTEIEVECPHCDEAQDIDLPFSGAEFWSPVKKRRGKVRT